MIARVAIARFFRRSTKRKIAAAFAVLLAAYVLSYALDSAAGGYWPIPDDAGGSGWTLSGPEDILWQPRYGYSSARWSSALGVFYAPLIGLDRRWRHKTHGTEDDGAGMYFQSSRPLTDFHPLTREYVRLARELYGRRVKTTPQALATDPEFIALRAENDRMLAESGSNRR